MARKSLAPEGMSDILLTDRQMTIHPRVTLAIERQSRRPKSRKTWRLLVSGYRAQYHSGGARELVAFTLSTLARG
jgi:hypothetical protein